MSSSLGNNLSELDRLLQELNAAQFNSPPSPQRDCLITADGSKALAVDSSRGLAQPHSTEPREVEPQGRAATEGLREHVGTSVPPQQGPPSSAQMCNAVPVHQPSRMSASSATRELDELMACLSDFKIQTNFSAPSDECIPRDVCLLKTDLTSTDKALSNMISTPSLVKRNKLQTKGTREDSGSDLTPSAAMTNGLHLQVDLPDVASTSPNLSSRSSSPLEVLCINEEALSLNLSTSDINSVLSSVNALPLALNKTKILYNEHDVSSVDTERVKEIQKKAPSKQLECKGLQEAMQVNRGDMICDVKSKKSSQGQLVLSSLKAGELSLHLKSIDPAKPNVPFAIKTDQSSEQYFSQKTAAPGIEMLCNKIPEPSSIDGPGNKIHSITDSVTTGNKRQQSLQGNQTVAVLHISDTAVTKCLPAERMEDTISAHGMLLNPEEVTSSASPLSESQSCVVTQNSVPALASFNQISAVQSGDGANPQAKAQSQIVFSEFPKIYVKKSSASTGDMAAVKATESSCLLMVTEPDMAHAALSCVKTNEPWEKTPVIPAMSSQHGITSNFGNSPQGTTAMPLTKPTERAKVSSLPSVPLETRSAYKLDVPHAKALKMLHTESKSDFPTPTDSINNGGGEVVACSIIDGKPDTPGTAGNTREDEKENISSDSGHEAAGDSVVIQSESFDFPPALPPEGIKKVSASRQARLLYFIGTHGLVTDVHSANFHHMPVVSPRAVSILLKCLLTSPV